MKWMVAGLIRMYQIFVSPRKGFSCAYRVIHGGDSCSEAIKKIVLDKGLLSGLEEIRTRFRSCSNAAIALRTMPIQNKQNVLDCGGVESCADPFSGCGDLISGDSTSGCGLGIGACNSSPINIVIIGPIGIILGFLFLSIMGWSYTQEVSTIQIRLLESKIESRDQFLGKLLGVSDNSSKSAIIEV